MRVGRHMGVEGDYSGIPERTVELSNNAFQIFTGNPRSWKATPLPDSVLTELGSECRQLDVIGVIHASYLINLCRDPESDKAKKSRALLCKDLSNAERWGERCLGVIIHMGKMADQKITIGQAMNHYVTNLRRVMEESEGRIILETGAGVQGEVGTCTVDLVNLARQLDRKRVGFCIDTAHIWAAGYDISTEKGVRSYFREWEGQIGTDRIDVIHFNDSAREWNSHVDLHTNIGKGLIGMEGLTAVAQWAKRMNVPLICETPGLVHPAEESETVWEMVNN